MLTKWTKLEKKPQLTVNELMTPNWLRIAKDQMEADLAKTMEKMIRNTTSFSMEGIVKEFHQNKNAEYLTIAIEIENGNVFFVRALRTTPINPKFDDLRIGCRVSAKGYIQRFKYPVINLIAEIVEIIKETK